MKAPPSYSVLISELKKYELGHPKSESCSISPPVLPVTDPFRSGTSMNLGPSLQRKLTMGAALQNASW